MTALKGSQLNLLATKLRNRGGIDTGDLKRLLKRAVKDGEVQPAEARALRQLLTLDSSELHPDARSRLDKLLAVERGDMLALAITLEQDDEVISLGDAAKLEKLVLSDEQIDSGERYTLSAMLAANRMSSAARNQLGELAQGRAPGAEARNWQQRIQDGEVTLADAPAALTREPAFVLRVLALRPSQLAQLPEPLSSDETFLTRAIAELPDCAKHLRAPVSSRAVLEAAIAVDGDLFSKGSETLQQYLPLARAAAANGYWIGGAPEHLRDDYEFVLANLKQHPRALGWASERLWADKNLIIEAVKLGFSPANLGPEMQGDRDVGLAAMQASGYRLDTLPEHLRDDDEIVETAVRDDWRALYAASDRLKAKRALVEQAVAQNGKALYAADPKFLKDRDLVLAACRKGNFSLQDADPALFSDPAVVMAAVRTDYSALSCAASTLQRHPDIVRAAIENHAKCFNDADPTLRRDPELALFALAQIDQREGGELNIDAALLRDPAFVRRAVQVNPSVLKIVDDDLRKDPALVRLAVSKNPEALRWAHTDLNNDPAYVGALIDELGGAVFSYASHDVRGNRALLDRALDDAVEAMMWASPELKKDRALARKALANKGKAFEWLDPELKKDKDLALFAVPIDPWAFWELDPSLKKDPDVVALAGACFPKSLSYIIPKDSKYDPALLERLVRANPLTLDQMDSRQRALALERCPEAEAACTTRQDALRELDIEFSHRMRPLTVLDEVIKNRQQPRDPADTRPTALMIYNKSDHNGAFSVDNMSQLTQQYRILYYEAETDTDVSAALKDAAARGEQAELFVMAGHGTREQTAMGAPDPAGGQPLDDEAFYVDTGDRALLEADLQSAIAAGANVVIESCSTGEGRGSMENVANLFASMLPTTTVYAPIEPTNNRIRVDEHGRFADPGFWRGKAETYCVG